MKILIVDDDVVDRKIIMKALGGIDIHRDITQTSSVSEGLAAMDKEHFDVILLDYKMPEADGIEMLYHLRSQPDLGKTAVVMVSASEDTELALSCIEAGAQDFVVKNEISQGKLSKAILHAKKRFELEKKMHDSYVNVKHMAERDPLTGLSNRYHFEETLKVMIANNKRTEHSIALLALDLDNFKHVNDTLGHDAGDSLLVQMVNRINDCLRQNEGFARLGGDEFAIILGGISQIGDVSTIADRILDTFKTPFTINGKEITCGMSIGVAIFPADAVKAADLVKSADIAMYRAKQSGKNRVCFYESQYQEDFNRRYAIQVDINSVLRKKTFSLHYQPLFDLQSNKIKSFEALIRWPLSGPSFYNPDEFIPISEETHQIVEIGQRVLKEALQQLHVWQSSYGHDLGISINVSPVQLRDDGFIEYVKHQLAEQKIDARTVTLEITETAFFKEKDKIAASLNALSALGLNIALDDFGMGYSSISHLMSYPIDVVKIDKSLQANEGDHHSNDAMFEALALMLKKLEFRIVAEGVETEKQLLLCRKHHIDKAQGYLLGKPVSAQEADDLLKQNQ
ncbi:EAL domain-containing protein [Glaciecola siphonariae]|uniref:EAL domain-containing protein n=1 Tax=Glaciecola siphonariae TaxID=521012 RepID=A0ABV9LRK6_9ALTE